MPRPLRENRQRLSKSNKEVFNTQKDSLGSPHQEVYCHAHKARIAEARRLSRCFWRQGRKHCRLIPLPKSRNAFWH